MLLNKTITKIGGLFVIVLGICLLLAVLFRPDLQNEIENQFTKNLKVPLKIQSQSTRLFPQQVRLYHVQIQENITCQIPEIQIDFSWLSAFQKNKTIKRIVLKNPTCFLPEKQQQHTFPELHTLFKQTSFTFPIEIQNASFSYQIIPALTFHKINLILAKSSEGVTATGNFVFGGKPFRTRFKVFPLQAGFTWATEGTAFHDKNVFLNFSFKFAAQRIQGFCNFSLMNDASFLGDNTNTSRLLSALSDKTEGTVSIDFTPQKHDFPLFIVRLINQDDQTAFTGHLSWQHAHQHTLTGELVIKELSGNLKKTSLSYFNWKTVDLLKSVGKINLGLMIQRLPLATGMLKNISVKLTGTGQQVFLTDGTAEFPGGDKLSFDGFLQTQQESLLKLRFDGKTNNVRPFLTLFPLPLQDIPNALLKRAVFNGTLHMTPQSIGLEMNQLDIDDIKLTGRLYRQQDGKQVSLKATVQNLNLDSYIPTKPAETPFISYKQLPSHIARWITTHWLHTASILNVDVSAKNSLYLNLPVEQLAFIGKLQDDIWTLQNLKMTNLAGLNIEGSGIIRLSGQHQLEIPSEFSLKLNSQQLPIFLQRAHLSPEKPKEILFDGSISGQDNILTAIGVWQEDNEPYEKIENQFNY